MKVRRKKVLASFALGGLMLVLSFLRILPFWGACVIFFVVLLVSYAMFCLNRLALGYDTHTQKLYADFPRSRNFDAVVFGGTQAFHQFGNKTDGGVLYITGPLRTFELNIEHAMRYYSYAKRGGEIRMIFDLDEVCDSDYCFADVSGLHPIQISRILGCEPSNFVRRFPLINRPRRTLRIAAAVHWGRRRKCHQEKDHEIPFNVRFALDGLRQYFAERERLFTFELISWDS